MTLVDHLVRPLVGIDVGGTKVLGVVADPVTGEVLDRELLPTPKAEPDRLASVIADVVAALGARHGAPQGIGVGLPGLVDHDGVLHYGPNVQGVLGLDVSPSLRSQFGVPVAVLNDADNAALAEHKWGAAKGASHAIVVTQGTGIGGALILNGLLMRGANGFAGEPGHMQIDRAGHRCACGRIGCWEAVASGAGLVNLTRELVAEGRGQAIVELAGVVDHLRGEHVAEGLRLGDPDAFEVVRRFADWVARGLAGLVNVLDPECIVLGGGLTSINSYFLDEVDRLVEAYTLGSGHRPKVPVRAAMLGPDAGAIGAVANIAGQLRG